MLRSAAIAAIVAVSTLAGVAYAVESPAAARRASHLTSAPPPCRRRRWSPPSSARPSRSSSPTCATDGTKGWVQLG
ncbi:hypothetical protein ZWY2020_044620 [Hordeum vulgare]|nr:hypothetical protein ZWY2020_044620 [Hordeum vulgare]